MKEKEAKLNRLSDYQIPDFLISHVELQFDLTQDPVQAKARLTIKANPDYPNLPQDLVLDGENMTLQRVKLDGQELSDQQHYSLSDHSLTIKNVPQNRVFTLETEVLLGTNADLFGLYKTEGTWLVKAETQGMRRVMYCKDRPDVLASYETTIIANESEFPTLLSNGRLIKEEKLPDHIQRVTWLDETPKPTYLFAMVAGNLDLVSTTFDTKSDHTVNIDFFVNQDFIDQCDYAQTILKKAMRWDEETYDLECGLSRHMVAGVNKYASGASEPTGLNLFNTENLFATAAIKTDTDFLSIANVVSHEYFHYWTGDRVTIRDWYNLCWKEGLTTFRAAEFCEQLFGRDLMRIVKGKTLDATVSRPDAYTAVRSLYTAAAYEKSAEIFRMIKTILGKGDFYTGLNRFLKENDGGAVTIENLFDSLQKSSSKDLSSMLPWFTQAGIPQLDITDTYNPQTEHYTLKIKQSGSNADYVVRPIPLKFGLLDENGKELVQDSLFVVDQALQELQFEGITSRPIPSLLRDFSAPVNLNYRYTESDLIMLMQHDTNLFNRSEAAKKMILNLVERFCAEGTLELSPAFFAAYRALLHNETINAWVLAEIITIPSESSLIEGLKNPDLDRVHEARELIVNALSTRLIDDYKICAKRIEGQLHNSQAPKDQFDIDLASMRRLKNVCLTHLSCVEPQKTTELVFVDFTEALGNNMSETIDALTLLCNMDTPESSQALTWFYERWNQDISAINYWFRIQAAAQTSRVVTDVRALLTHPAFDIANSNKLFALMKPFLKNPLGFHAASGAGYQLLTEVILQVDKIMPANAALLVKQFINWEKYDTKRQEFMHDQLVFLATHAQSVDVLDIVKKALEKPFKVASSVQSTPACAKQGPRPLSPLLWMEKQSQAVKAQKTDLDEAAKKSDAGITLNM